MENKNVVSINMSSIVLGLLGVAFIVLKLCGVISWSWWWVTAPFWIPAAIGLAVFICFIVWALAVNCKIKKWLK